MVQINRLVSLNRHLQRDFINHIENTQNICLYKLGNHYIPHNIFFPQAKTITLINCNNYGIQNILHPKFFPNVNTINYLSMNPRNNTLHTRFNSNMKWIFPDKNYEYYNYMVQSGYGKKDSELIKKYITNKKIVDGKNGFDISFEFDLNIPEYGIVSGDWWRSQFYEYLVKQKNINDSQYCLYPGEKIINERNTINQEIEEETLEKERVEVELQAYRFEDMINNND